MLKVRHVGKVLNMDNPVILSEHSFVVLRRVGPLGGQAPRVDELPRMAVEGSQPVPRKVVTQGIGGEEPSEYRIVIPEAKLLKT